MHSIRAFIVAFAISAPLVACGSPAEAPAAPATGAAAMAQTATPPAASPTAPMAAAGAAPAAFAQCRACHSVEAGKHGVGPSLHGVFGTRSGEIPDYAFSEAMKTAGLTWDEATLDRYLEKPHEVVPGSKMAYPGLPDPAARQAIIAYMKTLK